MPNFKLNKSLRAPIILLIIALPIVFFAGRFLLKEYQLQQSYKQDFALYERGVKAGLPLAKYALGYAYHTGHGITKNKQKAIKLYEEAAAEGSALAQYNLGFMYQYGDEVPKDLEKAIYYYEKAAEQDYPLALTKLSIMYYEGIGKQKNLEKSKNLYNKSLDNTIEWLQYEKKINSKIREKLEVLEHEQIAK